MRKTRASKWVMCQYCKRTIYKGEVVYKVRGMPYFICTNCFERREVKDSVRICLSSDYRVDSGMDVGSIKERR